MKARLSSKSRASSKRKPASASSEPGALPSKLVRIGNSRGVRLPKAVIEQAGLTDQLEIVIKKDEGIVIRPLGKTTPRAGWEEAFKKAIAEHGNELTEEDREWLDAPLSPEADKDWTW